MQKRETFAKHNGRFSRYKSDKAKELQRGSTSAKAVSSALKSSYCCDLSWVGRATNLHISLTDCGHDDWHTLSNHVETVTSVRRVCRSPLIGSSGYRPEDLQVAASGRPVRLQITPSITCLTDGTDRRDVRNTAVLRINWYHSRLSKHILKPLTPTVARWVQL